MPPSTRRAACGERGVPSRQPPTRGRALGNQFAVEAGRPDQRCGLPRARTRMPRAGGMHAATGGATRSCYRGPRPRRPSGLRPWFARLECRSSVDGSAVSGSRPSTTRSANFPGSIDPFSPSSNDAYAPCIVPTRSASSTPDPLRRAPDISAHVGARDARLERHHRLEGPGRVVGGLSDFAPGVEKAAHREHPVETVGAVLPHLLAVKVHVRRKRIRDHAERPHAPDQRRR